MAKDLVKEFKSTINRVENFLRSGLILSEFLREKVNEYYNPLKSEPEERIIKLIAVLIREDCQQLLDLLHGEEDPLYDNVQVEDSFPGPYTYQIGVLMENTYCGWDLLNLAILGALNYMCAEYDDTSLTLRIKTIDSEYTIPDTYIRDLTTEDLNELKYTSVEVNALKLMSVLTNELTKDIVKTTLRYIRSFKDDGDVTHLRHILDGCTDSLHPILKMVVNL